MTLNSSERIRVPLLDKLIPGGITPPTIFVVEYDPKSQWLAVASTIAARSLLGNGHVGYVAFTRPPEDVKRDLSKMGVDVALAQESGRLIVDDWYSATLAGGRLEPKGAQAGIVEAIPGGMRVLSLRITDLSVEWLKTAKSGPQSYDKWADMPAGTVGIGESTSVLLRFNEEKPFVEYMETRSMPENRKFKRIIFYGLVRGIHSEWLYNRFEAACDGVIEIKVMEHEGEAKNFIRLTSLKGQQHDARWHEIAIEPNGEARLAT